MGDRLVSWCGAAGLAHAARVVVLAVLTACGNGAQHRPPPDEASVLVIPPLGADASAPVARDLPPEEPADIRTALTIRARDPRIAKRHPRSRVLVMTEVQGLERLLATTPESTSERPAIRQRLAEVYNELAYTSNGADAARARDELIKNYVAIKGESPQFAQMDEVLYYLGLAYELNRDLASARRSYFELIKNHPTSKLVPLAYFAFGELFFAEAAADPSKNALALESYAAVLKYPRADNPVYADALLRTGETHLRMNADAKARETFDRLRREFADSEAAERIPSSH